MPNPCEEPAKLILVGDSGCGKSAYLKRVCTGIFDPACKGNTGVEVHPLTIETTSGQFSFNVWDIPGNAGHIECPDSTLYYSFLFYYLK